MKKNDTTSIPDDIRIVRSRNRYKTIQAREVDGVLEILAPASMSDKDLKPYVDNLKDRIERQKRKVKLDDTALERRASELNHQYFEGRLRWNSVRWVTNQNVRWGSCTPVKGTIRISHRIVDMPPFVLDYILIHEMAHLLEPNHGKRFWDLVYQYPRTERARGFLMAAGFEKPEE